MSILLPPAGFADTEAMPWAYVKASATGQFCFKMVPPKWHMENEKVVVDREAYGVAYRVGEEGELDELWRTSGWYSFEVFLSEDGRYLVQLGPWARDQENHTDLAIAFYDRGQLLKKYQVRDLLKDPAKAVNSVSHYQWRPARQSEPTGLQGALFHLVMADHTTYSFELATGAVSALGHDDQARNLHELRTEEENADAQKGQALFEKWKEREAFEKLFEISQVRAVRGLIMGVSFAGPEWEAHLTPKENFKPQCLVEAVFPIEDGQRIVTSVSPEEVRNAFKIALEHPFVVARIASQGATGARLRMIGDRLHWDTPELQKMLQQLIGKQPAADSLRHWAYFVLDEKDHHYGTFYLNTMTGELICEDESKWPREAMLFDSAGNRIEARKDAKK